MTGILKNIWGAIIDAKDVIVGVWHRLTGFNRVMLIVWLVLLIIDIILFSVASKTPLFSPEFINFTIVSAILIFSTPYLWNKITEG